VLQWVNWFVGFNEDAQYVGDYLREAFTAFLWPTVCECVPTSPGTCYPVLPTGALGSTSADVQNFRFGVELYANVSGLIIYGVTVRFATVGGGVFNVVTIDQHDVQVVTQNFAGVAGLHTYLLPIVMPIDHTGSGNVYDVILRFPNAGYTFTYESVNVTPVNTTQLHYNKFIYQSDLTSGMIDWTPAHLPMDPVICTYGGPSGVSEPFVPPEPTDPADIPDHPDPSCATTADLCAKMNALMAAVLGTRRDVDWLQSAIAPDCWAPGTPSAGLTGHGTIAVADVVGAYVTLTAPSSWGETTETPPRFIPKVGELQFAVDTVVAQHHELHYGAEQVLGAPTATNSIVYNLRPGVTATITPLQRCK